MLFSTGNLPQAAKTHGRLLLASGFPVFGWQAYSFALNACFIGRAALKKAGARANFAQSTSDQEKSLFELDSTTKVTDNY